MNNNLLIKLICSAGLLVQLICEQLQIGQSRRFSVQKKFSSENHLGQPAANCESQLFKALLEIGRENRNENCVPGSFRLESFEPCSPLIAPDSLSVISRNSFSQRTLSFSKFLSDCQCDCPCSCVTVRVKLSGECTR